MSSYNYDEEVSEAIRKFYIEAGLTSRQSDCLLHENSACEGQEQAFQAAEKFSRCFLHDIHTKGILFVGGVGSGKTFLASCIVNECIRNAFVPRENYRYISVWEKYYSMRFTTVVDLISHLRERINADGALEYSIRQFQSVDLLILDDLGAEKESDWTREILFRIIDYRYNEYLPLIVTTNCVPDELKEKIGDRNFDRLREMCVLVPITAKSQRITATFSI